MRSMPIIVFLITLLALVSCSPKGEDGGATNLRALDEAYVNAWKEAGADAQQKAVMALLADDAVIMPGGGLAPRRGKNEIRTFWFPSNAPSTKVEKFEHIINGVESSDNLGVIHGRFVLEFKSGGQHVRESGNYLIVARRTPNEPWRIAELIWNNDRSN